MTATYEGNYWERWFVVRDDEGNLIARRQLWSPPMMTKEGNE